MTVHSGDPRTGLRTGGALHGTRGAELLCPALLAVLPREPGVLTLAPRDTPPESTVVVMLGHSPLVILP